MILASICGLAILVTAQVPPPATGPSAAARLREERRSILDGESARLEGLAKRLDGQRRADAAKEVRAKIEPAPDANGPTRFRCLPEIVPGTAMGLSNVPSRPVAAEAWRSEMKALREATASSLFAMAERAATATPKHLALADECLRQVIARQPDHAEARRLLGFVPFEGGWATPYARGKRQQKEVDHPVFGWVPQAWIEHLERGELPAPPARGRSTTKWLPADEANAEHSEWESRWKISTEHFRVETNVPLSEAIAFGRQLEAFHELFFAQLADLFAADNRLPLAQRFANKKMQGERNPDAYPHLVYYFKAKQEYVDYLSPIEPNIDGSLGIYIPARPGKVKRAPAYFFRDPDGQIAATATLFHEVSHQLLFESGGRHDYDRNVGNYWVFEGLGTYFETVTMEADGTLSVGGLVGPRIEEARKRLEAQQFLPAERLVRLGKAAFNREEVIHLHYAQSMALAVFLMQADDCKYRESFLDYVKDAYRGLLKGTTGRQLNSRLGVSYDALDEQFRAFLRRG